MNRLENRLAFEPGIAAGSWISDSQFSDIDAQAAQYQGYEQQYQQLSPGPFTLQLNEVRRDLLAAVDEEESIGMIAARRGIWHWSRFSSYYRALFGELPSETRRTR